MRSDNDCACLPTGREPRRRVQEPGKQKRKKERKDRENRSRSFLFALTALERSWGFVLLTFFFFFGRSKEEQLRAFLSRWGRKKIHQRDISIAGPAPPKNSQKGLGVILAVN